MYTMLASTRTYNHLKKCVQFIQETKCINETSNLMVQQHYTIIDDALKEN